jgi:DNA polymerase-1
VAAESTKPPVFLLDAMSFIFRAYHAMQRSRPMSTRTGVPTAATYVFVNMINKLRRDFSPEYFAAVFDVSGPVFRDERARGMTVNKFSTETQKFEAVETGGYKAKREAMPPDLAQQLPYVRRALEAFRIPILEAQGFEADDVIGTLAAKAAKAGHPVLVVSNDKDMMQLVNDQVKILNPVKDNLVLDREKVMETLGVPPEKVVDVMALRGDSIDNIPGAPGIGDKGSVELIQQFGSVEAALDRAEEIKGKRYRESLQNNREAVLLSKELVTIHCEVPVEFDPEAMRTQAPDTVACRTLFTELEFATLLRELAPAVPTTAVEYVLEPTAEQISAFVARARKDGFALALAASELEAAAEQVSEQESEALEEREPELKTMSLLDLVEAAEAACETAPSGPPECRIGVAAAADEALLVPLDAVRELLEDAVIPKLQYQFAEAAGRCAVQQDGPAEADEVWQGQGGFDGAGCAGGAGGAVPIAALVLEHRQLQKLKGRIWMRCRCWPMRERGALHTTFNQVGTATGRLSSTNPNLQNIPMRTELGREIRAAFIAAPGMC